MHISMFHLIVSSIIFITKLCESQRRGQNRGNTPSPVEQQQNLLNEAKEKFETNNHGYYSFQYQKSCICPVCETQSMNVLVEDNRAIDVSFAEGNEYALKYFCFDDNIRLTDTLTESQITILNLFEMIQDAIASNDNIGVTYHDEIGIPLSISLSVRDEEIFISVNCLQFDLSKTSSPTAEPSDSRNRRNGRRNRRNSSSNDDDTQQRETFNDDDPYSCQNIHTPSCPIGYFYCYRFYDGCNTCTCNEVGDTVGCTKRMCEEELFEASRCVDCESNTEWTECGNDPHCIPTCAHPDNYCGIDGNENGECNSARCECPSSTPRWDGYECITVEECQRETETDTDTTVDSGSELLSDWCVPHCDVYSDGCLSCSCDAFRKPEKCDNIADALALCTPSSFEDRKCEQCEDAETMEYTLCGTIDITCNDIGEFVEETECFEKCECKQETPIYDPINKKCIKIEECEDDDDSSDSSEEEIISKCIQHCPVYYDGCNACQCPNYPFDPEFCSNLECQSDDTKSTCFRCEMSSMEYTKCGKCDRTCDDTEPECLSDTQCIEKCQCPLDLPIYFEGECITAEQCPNTTTTTTTTKKADDDDDDDFGDPIHSNVEKEIEGHKQLQWNGDNNNNSKWEIYVTYSIIGIIVILSGFILLCWPNIIRKISQYRKRKLTNKKIKNKPNGENNVVITA